MSSEKKHLRNVIDDLEQELLDRDIETRRAKKQVRVFYRIGAVLLGWAIVDYVLGDYYKS